MYRLIFIDMTVAVISAPDTTLGQPAGELRVIKTGEQTMDGARRYYYAANPPRRLLIVARNGVNLEATRPGQYWQALIGWDDGDNAYVLSGDEGKRHTKLTVDMLIDLPIDAVETIPLSTVVDRAPRSDRPGGVRGTMTGRPPVQPGDRVEQHNITLPSRLWRRAEDVGQGNRSAGVYKLIEGETAMPVSLPPDVTHILKAISGGTAIAIEVDNSTAIVVKCEQKDAQSAHRPGVQVAFQSMLGCYPDAGAIIRLALEIRDRPESSLKFETFLNPGHAYDLGLLRKLAGQSTLEVHLFDMWIRYQYTKILPFREVARGELTVLIESALEFLSTIPESKRDFGKARDQMMAEIPL